MAHPDAFPDDVRRSLAVAIGDWLATTPRFKDRRKSNVELAETFTVWTLELRDVFQVGKQIGELAKDIGRRHHQIRFDGKAGAFARSPWRAAKLA